MASGATQWHPVIIIMWSAWQQSQLKLGANKEPPRFQCVWGQRHCSSIVVTQAVLNCCRNETFEASVPSVISKCWTYAQGRGYYWQSVDPYSVLPSGPWLDNPGMVKWIFPQHDTTIMWHTKMRENAYVPLKPKSNLILKSQQARCELYIWSTSML